jgi:hypothetical protein
MEFVQKTAKVTRGKITDSDAEVVCLNRVNRRAANSDEWLNSPRHWAGGSKSAQQQRCYRLPGESRPRPRHCWCQLELGDAGES